MADPTTELTKEFLELYGYNVRTNVRFYKTKIGVGTPGDVDILATRKRQVRIGGVKFGRCIVGEAKHYEFESPKSIDELYLDKFEHIDDRKISAVQLANHFGSSPFDKILFCQYTTNDIYEYAWRKYKLRIIPSGFLIKTLANLIKSEKKWPYYPEYRNYFIIRALMNDLTSASGLKFPLELRDLLWLNPNGRYVNRFVRDNGDILAELLYQEEGGSVLKKAIQMCFAKQEDRKWLKEVLKSDADFWSYLA